MDPRTPFDADLEEAIATLANYGRWRFDRIARLFGLDEDEVRVRYAEFCHALAQQAPLH